MALLFAASGGRGLLFGVAVHGVWQQGIAVWGCCVRRLAARGFCLGLLFAACCSRRLAAEGCCLALLFAASGGRGLRFGVAVLGVWQQRVAVWGWCVRRLAAGGCCLRLLFGVAVWGCCLELLFAVAVRGCCLRRLAAEGCCVGLVCSAPGSRGLLFGVAV